MKCDECDQSAVYECEVCHNVTVCEIHAIAEGFDAAQNCPFLCRDCRMFIDKA
jgi:hypothetical protein